MECIRLEQEDLTSLTDKELIKKIKEVSNDWRDWSYNENNAKYYQEIERRNRLVEYPQGKYGKIFRDDPQAIQKMQDKIKVLEARKDYWKKIIKFPARTYNELRGALGDQKWYAAAAASTDLNMAKKKLALIENQGTLTRKPTYVKDREGTSRRRFYYTEESD